MNIQEFEKELDICLKKLNKEIDLDWIEIVDELGLDIHYDSLRRVAYGYRKYHEYIQSKGLDSIGDDMYSKLLEKEIEIKKLMTKLSDMRALVNKDIRSQSRYEHLLETVKEVATKLEENNPFEIVELSIPNDEDICREGLLLISDFHYGQVTKSFLNDYNSNEFDKRLKFLTGRVIEISKLHKVKKLNIMGLGDYMNGLIHTTTRLSNRESIAEQVVQVSDKLCSMIYEFSKEIPYVTFSMTDDNHSRIFANKSENTEKDSFVLFMKELIKRRLRELSNVVFLENTIDSGISYINICDRIIVGVHGDKDKMSTAIPRMTSLLKSNIDYMCMAHYHNCKEDTYGETELIVNGAFGGSDEYAKSLRLHSAPMQKYMIFSRPYGRECTYNIDVRGKQQLDKSYKTL